METNGPAAGGAGAATGRGGTGTAGAGAGGAAAALAAGTPQPGVLAGVLTMVPTQLLPGSTAGTSSVGRRLGRCDERPGSAGTRVEGCDPSLRRHLVAWEVPSPAPGASRNRRSNHLRQPVTCHSAVVGSV